MAKPKLEKIENKLKKGENFSLSRNQYFALTGTDIPQSKYYTEKNSAIAKKAKIYGYTINVIPEILEFKKETL